MAITFNHNDKLYVSGSNVGIGTDSPSSILHLENAGNTWAKFINTSGTNQRLDVGTNSSSQHFVFGYGDYPVLFGSNGSERMRITSGGNVGIGTTSPSYKLHVVDSATEAVARFSGLNDTTIIIGGSDLGSGEKYITYQNATTGSDAWLVGMDDDEHFKFAYGAQLEITDAKTKMTILQNGNVGIGTTSPTAKLHVSSASGITIENTATTNVQLKLRSNGVDTWRIGQNLVVTGATALEFYDDVNNVDRMVITNTGNVGIGTTSPSDRLDVTDGNAKMVFGAASSDRPWLYFQHNAVPTDGEEVGLLDFRGYNDASQDTRYVILTAKAEDVTDGSEDGSLTFQTMAGGTATQALTMRSGSVGIGTSNPAQKLDVVGKMKISDDIILAQTNGRIDYDNGVSTGALRFWSTSAGAERMRITSAGNVGIGTTSPSGKLHSYISTTRQMGHNAVGGDLGVISDNNSAPVLYVKGTGTADLVNVFDDTTEVFTILDGGNVGIGTTSPSNRLTVYQGGGVRVTGIASGSYIEISGDLPGYNANQYPVIKSGGTIHFANNGKYAAYLEGNDTYLGLINSTGTHTVKLSTNGETYFNGGNVGIGTTSPSRKLTVSDSGAANGSQNITAQFGNVTVGATSSAVYIGAYTGTDWLIGKNIYGNSNHYNFEIGNQASGSSPVISINNSNNVGIGTISPGAKLDVRADAPSTSGSIIYVRNTLADGSNNTFGGISFFSSPGTDYTIGKLNTGSASALAFSNANNGTEYMRIDSSGNVGIGTDSPGIELDVAGGIRATAGTSNGLRVHTNSGITASNNYMNFFTSQSSGWAFNANGTGADSDTKVVITAGGNVGIGTTAPAKKLTIGGSSPHVLLDGNFDDDSKANQGRVYFNDYNFGIGAGHMSADVNTDDDLYLWTYDGGGRGIRFMSTTNGDTDVTGTAWKTMMVITSDADGGNVGIGTTTPGAKLDVEGLILSDQIQTKEYTSLTGSSGDWFPIGAITDQYTGPVRYSILTYAHSSIDFIVSEAYSLANTHNITVLNSNYGANGGFANVSAVRVRQDGGVEIKLVWSSGPSVQVRITVRGTYGTPTLPSSLATTTNTSTVIDTVDNGSGKMRTQKTLEVGSTVLLNYSGSSYLNGGNFGIGTTSPGAKLTIVSGGKGIHVDKGSHSSTSANLSECRTNYAFAYDTLRNGSTTGFFITNVGTNTPAMQAVDSSNNAQNISIQPYGGNVGIGTTSPDFKLDTRISRASGSFLTDGQVYALGLQNTDTTAGNATAMAFGHGGYKYTNFIASVRTGTGANPKGDLVFGGRPTDASTFVERMRILANGNVGIGTTGPNQKLHVEGAISAGTANSTSGSLILVGKYNNGNIITIGGEYSNGGIVIGYGVKPSTTASGAFLSSSGLANLQRGAYNQVGSDHYWWGGTYQTVAEGSAVTMSRLMTLNGAGNLGLGTTSPNYRLHVDNSGLSTNSAALYVKNPNSSSNAVIAEFVGDSDAIQIKNINVGDYAIYNTQQSNGIALYDGTGGVEIHYNGSTRLEADSNGGIKVTGQLSATGDVVAYSSDERLKENIKPIENAVDKIKQLKGVTFDWNEKSQELGFEPSTKTNDVGVIAQDVEAVFPQLVHLAPFDIGSDEEGKATSKTGEDYKTVNYARLTAVLIEAVKEQQQQIDELKEIINGLTK